MEFKARIYLSGENKISGSESGDGFSGMKPHININEELHSCIIFCGKEGTRMPLKKEYDVSIKILFGNEQTKNLQVNSKFGLNIASRIIGYGIVTEI